MSCLGRIDTQVKIRGHRVELEEIEACVVAHPAVREAACILQDNDRGTPILGAWLVLGEETESIDPSALREHLRSQLPAHMIPAQFGFLETLPRSAGDKVDRKRLPTLDTDTLGGDEVVVAESELEKWVEAAFREGLGGQQALSVTADFFEELGGNSLAAAVAISRLREDSRTDQLTVRDLYAHPTVRGLVARATTGERGSPGDDPSDKPPTAAVGTPATTTMLQVVWLVAAAVLSGPLSWLLAYSLLPKCLDRLPLPLIVSLSPAAIMLVAMTWTPFALAMAVLAKKVLIGRYTPGREPAYGSFHLRNWIVQRFVRLIPWGLLQGTIFHNAALRALGARIGQRVHIHRGVDLLGGGWDLLSIGDDVTLAQDSSLRMIDMIAGEFVLGPIEIGKGATLEVRAGLSPGTTLEEGAALTALSVLPEGARIPSGERWSGVPAVPAGVAGPAPEVTEERGVALTPAIHGAVTLGANLMLATIRVLPVVAALIVLNAAGEFDSIDLVEQLYGGSMGLWLPLSIVVCASVPLTLLLEACACRCLGQVQSGTYSRWGWCYLRIWAKSGVLQRAGRVLSGTLFWPWWLRLAGMRIGRGCEISTIIDVVPERVSVGEESFFADGIYLGGPAICRGRVTVGDTHLSERTFLGNHAVIGAGEQLPSDILLGVCTVSAGVPIEQGSSWFGHPKLRLPRREVVGVARQLTHDPSLIRVCNRLFWEGLRFMLPLVPLSAALAWLELTSDLPTNLTTLCVTTPLVSLGLVSAICMLVVIMKWALLGRVTPGTHPLWSCWCSRWDFLYVAWGAWARGWLSLLEGTLVLPWYLRAMGCRIGKRTFLGGGFAQVVDPDMIEIEDGATFAGLFQAHTFEDRVLKTDHGSIGAGSTVAAGAVLLYGAKLGQHTVVGPHSVVMKQERLRGHRTYQGCPI